MKNGIKICGYFLIILVIVLGLFWVFKNKKIDVEEKSEEMKLIINEEEYEVILEDNDTVKSLMAHVPLKVIMNELNGNEKYVYLDFNIPSDSEDVKKIEKGDVMLYGSSCLVIFYKSFETNYSYTKIGHINNLKDLDNGSIEVKIEK